MHTERTDEEIIARIEEIKHRDFLGWEMADLIARLPFEKAKAFIGKEITEEQYGDPVSARQRIYS